jgi:hypothetical protein
LPCTYYDATSAGEQIEEMIHLLGLTDRATRFVGELARKIFLESELGIGPGPQ